MKAMILAAGRGERMRPLTDTCPKPLLQVRGRPLIVWQILNLVKAGITDIVINHAWLGQMIEDTVGDGSKYGANIRYSPEGTALETAGGIAQARHLLGEDPFVVVSADIYCPYFDFEQVKSALEDEDPWGNPLPKDERDIAWLYLVKNPPFHPEGDFGVNRYTLTNDGTDKYTFANIGVYRMEMFDQIPAGQVAPLGPLLREYISQGRIGGEVYRGDWHNVGTPEQLAALNTTGVKP